MNIKEKLQQFEKKVSSAEAPSQDFYNLIGIELYDFIESNDQLKNAFLKHSDFLIRISKDPDFIALQDNIYDTIQEALGFTNDKEVDEIQKIFNSRMISRLKKEGDLTLPEVFNFLKDKNSYYRLGDNVSTMQGELSLFTHVLPIRIQYEFVGAILEHHILVNKINKGEDTALFQEAIKKFGNLINQLDELIYKQPIKLHIKDFEEFIIFCSQIYKRKGYEVFYEFRHWLPPLRTPPAEEEFKRKKKSCLIVIDDLITEIDNNDEKNFQTNQKSKKIGLVDGLLHGTPQTKALHRMIVEDKLNSIDNLEKELEELKKQRESDNNKYENSESEEQSIKISKIIIKKYKDIKLEPRDKKGWLQLKKGGKWIDLGGYNTRTYKMVNYILMPSSKSKMVADVFEYIKIKKDDKNEDLQKETPRAYQLKKKIIEETVDVLQKEEYLKGNIKKPKFDDKTKTVTITFS